MCVAAGLVLGSLPEVFDGKMGASRIFVVIVGAWHAVSPAAVVLAAGKPLPSWLELSRAYRGTAFVLGTH